MQPDQSFLIAILILAALQFVLSGGFISFLIIARQQSERVFPQGRVGSSLPRYMYRRRLELVASILLMEVIVLLSFPVLLTKVLFSEARVPLFYNINGLLLIIASALVVSVVSIISLGLAVRKPESFSFFASFVLLPLYIILRPISFILIKVVTTVFPALSREFSSSLFMFSEEANSSEGFIEENGSKLMHSIVEFGVKKVKEVMVPRIDVFALDVGTSCEEARVRVSEVGHSRVPVYERSIDKIVGILYVKDLLKLDPGDYEDVSLEQIAREAYFVPESKKIDDLLREFQREKKHMAIVVDEYGGTSGIVTLEDILEEIVGEIRDEYDHEKPLVRELSDREYLVEGRINLEELSDETGIVLDAQGVETLGGFIFNLLQRVPEEGEELEHFGIKFIIKKLEGQRITEVIIKLPDDGKGDRS